MLKRLQILTIVILLSACGTTQQETSSTASENVPSQQTQSTKPSKIRKVETTAQELERSRLLLSRLTWGARPGEVKAVALSLSEFRARSLRPSPKVTNLDTRFPVMWDEPTLLNKFPRKNGRMELDSMLAEGDHRDLLRLTQQRAIVRAIEGEGGFAELLTDFWFNHFSVYGNKAAIRYVLVNYEDSLRDEVFGNFGSMLLNTAQHPAMLMYLDNAQSVRTGFKDGRGLNENYARELLELHTLGEGNGYSQKDVTETARVLTGWNMRRKEGVREFVFRRGANDKGSKTVLGQAYKPGEEAAKTLISRLAMDQRTAARISKKLVERFVASPAPEALVTRLSEVFIENNGDLQPVVTVLLAALEESATPQFKSPFEYVVSAARLVGAKVEDPKPTYQALQLMKMLPYGFPVPTGYPVGERWLSTSTMLERARFAKRLAFGQAGLTFNLSEVVPETTDAESTVAWAESLIGPLSGDTKKVIGPLFGASEQSRKQRLMALLASPEFSVR